MANCCNSKRVTTIALWISIPILILSLAMVVGFGFIYDSVLKKDISLGEGSLLSKIWEDIPLPIYEKLYFFNISNVEAFLDGSESLNVTEVGPYTYKSRWVKPNPQWHQNNTVSYREVRTYHFIQDMSIGTQDDLIYTLNAPMILASDFVKNKAKLERMLISGLFWANHETLVVKKSIRDLVYDGYEDPIIKYGTKFIKRDLPYKDGKFSWLYGKNDTDDGLFTVFTGVDDASKTNFIHRWNGQEKLSFWKGDPCNKLDGTSIETGPPIDGVIESYTFFQSIFCRSLTFNYTEDVIHHDVTAKRFKPTRNLFANSTENPDNYCFEVNKEHASGVLDVSPCQFGAPVFISFPHFHLADSSYTNAVNGLNPNDDKHGSYIDVEAITGLSIDLAIRFQINIQVKKVRNIGQFKNARDGIYPVFWAELSLELDEKMADFLKSKLRNPKIIAYSVLISLAGVSLILIIASAIALGLSSKKKDDRKVLINNTKDDTSNKFSKSSNGNIYDYPTKNIDDYDEYESAKQTDTSDFNEDTSEFPKQTSNR